MFVWCFCNIYICKYKCIFNILMNNYGNVLKMIQSFYKICIIFIIIIQFIVYIEFVLIVILYFIMINYGFVVLSCVIYMFIRFFLFDFDMRG